LIRRSGGSAADPLKDPERAEALERAVARVRELAKTYEAPSFEHVPSPDAAVFLCAVDHKTGYTEAHEVEGSGPLAGSELLWTLGLRAHASDQGLLAARRLRYVSAGEVAEWFRIDGETVADPERRAFLWRDLAAGLERDHRGSAQALLDSAASRLSGDSGLVSLLRAYEAYRDPLAKKAYLFAKIAERRGWFEVEDPEAWEVSADNVLMRLALRSGLVPAGPLEEVRPATRAALKELAVLAGLSPPVLDDMLWEQGRDDPDLLGAAAGDIREPDRATGAHWY
jgi:hypothetical protein